jgi:hypothetical protein
VQRKLPSRFKLGLAIKKQVFGRKAGSKGPMVLLQKTSGFCTGGRNVEPGAMDAF